MSGEGRTPLFIAVLHGHIGIVALLLDAGADADEPEWTGTHTGDTPLHVVAGAATTDGYYSITRNAKNDAEIARALIKAGANVHAKEGIRGNTPLHDAARADNLEIASAGSENSDQVLSGNSDHLPVALPGQKIVGHSASDEERMIDMLKRRIAAEDLRRGADIKSYFTELSLVEAFFMI
jgi:ankyrin repeat protein